MDSTLQKIGKFEAIAIITMIMINEIILNLPNSIIVDIGTSSALNIIYISIIAILFCLLICKLFKNFSGKDILDISEIVGGKFLKILIGILYVLFFIFISGTLLRYLANSLKIIYFDETPLVFLLILFLIPVAVSAYLGIKAVSHVNLIITPILLLSMLILLLSSSKNFIFQRLFPVFGFGLEKTFITRIK